MPRDYNLKETLAQVYAEEVAAFYDPKTKTMHLIEEPKTDVKKPTTFLERLFGKKADFDKDENKTVIAHELTHALADQHYDLDAMQEAIKKDDDRSLALDALIEGEATLAMFGVGMDDWKGEDIVRLPAERMELTFNLLAPFMPVMGGGKTLRDAPPIISESMIFPYFKGMVFCAKLTNEGGWAAIDDVYRNPPLSTEQILHPEKYRAKPDFPMTIDLGTLEAGRRLEGSRPQRSGRDADWRSCSASTAARRPPPAGTAIAMPSSRARKTSSAWSGSPPGTAKTTPASSPMATSPIRQRKWAISARRPSRSPIRFGGTSDDRLYVVQRRGDDVAVVEGFSPAATPRSWKLRSGQADRGETAAAERRSQPRRTPKRSSGS